MHLTLSDRCAIANCLNNRDSFKAIATWKGLHYYLQRSEKAYHHFPDRLLRQGL